MGDLFIAGHWTTGAASGRREITCPADGSHVGTVTEATDADTLAAIAAARAAFDTGPWPSTPARERGALLARVADLLERDAAQIARAESLDTGKRYVESEYDVADVVSVFRHYAAAAVAGSDLGRVVDTGRASIAATVVKEDRKSVV